MRGSGLVETYCDTSQLNHLIANINLVSLLLRVKVHSASPFV